MRRYLILFLIGTVLLPTAHAVEPPAITKNPFTRPAWEVVAEDIVLVPNGSATQVSMDLRATMVGQKDAFANVAGRIVAVGESVQGYEIVEILEDRAVFEHQGSRITVFVRPPEDDDDE